ncbi:uncharacterized protein LOC125240199 [Leguminivora glycinivorella]|uniref:uncharacterized protein LOC125240199 n=1 Tax=Leguminivora glycinivorella TaxID=1035111 RepID=UPI00200D8DBA|nr:uncharacterized protein LOC125240199 [Leguminivora glycinivorella]
MYKLVFLLVFSVLADSGATLEGYSGGVKPDVSYLSQAKMTNDFLIQERESETYPSASKALNVYFDISFTTNNEGTTTVNLNINPGGVIQVSEGQKIQFYATTVTDLYDFGCTNDKGITVIVPKIKLVQEDGIKKLWSLSESKQYSKTDIGERWDCFYEILQPDGTIVNARKIERKGKIYIQDEFSLQLQIIEPKPSTPSHPYQLRSKDLSLQPSLLRNCKRPRNRIIDGPKRTLVIQALIFITRNI